MSAMRRALRVVVLLVAVLGTLGGWLGLVLYAVDAGESARAGDTGDWWYVGLATVGAIVLLLVGIALGRRLAVALGLVADYVPKRAKRR